MVRAVWNFQLMKLVNDSPPFVDFVFMSYGNSYLNFGALELHFSRSAVLTPC